MAPNHSNLDAVVPLHPGESSESFTFDADAVVVGAGQTISGKTNGSFKVSAGSVEIKDGKDGKLVLFGSNAYFAMKKRADPEGRAGYQPEEKTPEQWKIHPTPAQMNHQRQTTSATVKQRYWSKFKAALHLQ